MWLVGPRLGLNFFRDDSRARDRGNFFLMASQLYELDGLVLPQKKKKKKKKKKNENRA